MRKFWTILLIIFAAIGTAEARKPLIGISTSYSNDRCSAYYRYSQVIEKAGGIPMLIPLTKDEKVAEETIKYLDGIMFIGGEDFDPAIYGEKIFNSTVKINGTRDTSDLLLMKAALKSKISILAICRGAQLLNISLGGSLYQDLPEQYFSAMPHSSSEHIVRIEADSKLGHILGASGDSGEYIRLEVNSFHHQALKAVPKKLEIVGEAPDGIVEAVEMPGRRFVIGVQFHPEILAYNGNSLWQKLFNAFVKSAK